jgi:hypothetical protein
MRIGADDYERMRAWFETIAPELFADLPAEADPLAALDSLAATSPARAREGLAMAVGDIVEMTHAWPRAKVAALDARLRSKGLPTLTEIRARFSRAVARALRRGRISDEAEYHALRNAAEFDSAQSDALWALLADYEERSLLSRSS